MYSPYLSNNRESKKSISSQNTDLPPYFGSKTNNILNTNISQKLNMNNHSQPRRPIFNSSYQKEEVYYPKTINEIEDRTPTKLVKIFDSNARTEQFLESHPTEETIKNQPQSQPTYIVYSDKIHQKSNFNKAPSQKNFPPNSVYSNRKQSYNPSQPFAIEQVFKNHRVAQNSPFSNNVKPTFGNPHLLPQKSLVNKNFAESPQEIKKEYYQNPHAFEQTQTQNFNSEPLQSGFLSRRKIESALSEMKNRILEMKAFSCNCNFFRLNIDSLIIRVFKHTIPSR